MHTKNTLFVRRTLSTALLSAFALSGCGTVDPTGPTPDPDDTLAPQVASTQPAAKATAVAADTAIVVQFSEPMDMASVEAAYSSTDLPAASVAFAWNADGTTLTITPADELVYAEGIGIDPSTVAAKTYAFTIGATATDLIGNALGAPFELTFATKRRMFAAFPLDLTLTSVRIGSGTVGSATEIWVGDNAVANTFRSFITFDLTMLPSSTTIESAKFSARQLAPQGSPYNLGPVMAHHVTYPDFANLLALQPMSLPGAYSSNAVAESKVIDVTSQVADDIANRATRNSRTQYRLQIDTPTNNDAIVDKAIFAKDTFQLTTAYIAD